MRKTIFILLAILIVAFSVMSCKEPEKPEQFSEYPFSDSTNIKATAYSDTKTIGGTYLCYDGISYSIFSFAPNGNLYYFDSDIETGTWSFTDNLLYFSFPGVNVQGAEVIFATDSSTGKCVGFVYDNAYSESIIFVRISDDMMNPSTYHDTSKLQGKVFGVTDKYGDTDGYGFSTDYCYKYNGTNKSSFRYSVAIANNKSRIRLTANGTSTEYYWLVFGDYLVIGTMFTDTKLYRLY